MTQIAFPSRRKDDNSKRKHSNRILRVDKLSSREEARDAKLIARKKYLKSQTAPGGNGVGAKRMYPFTMTGDNLPSVGLAAERWGAGGTRRSRTKGGWCQDVRDREMMRD
jgi:hypothetical protein